MTKLKEQMKSGESSGSKESGRRDRDRDRRTPKSSESKADLEEDARTESGGHPWKKGEGRHERGGREEPRGGTRDRDRDRDDKTREERTWDDRDKHQRADHWDDGRRGGKGRSLASENWRREEGTRDETLLGSPSSSRPNDDQQVRRRGGGDQEDTLERSESYQGSRQRGGVNNAGARRGPRRDGDDADDRVPRRTSSNWETGADSYSEYRGGGTGQRSDRTSGEESARRSDGATASSGSMRQRRHEPQDDGESSKRETRARAQSGIDKHSQPGSVQVLTRTNSDSQSHRQRLGTRHGAESRS